MFGMMYSWDGVNKVFNPQSTLLALSKTNQRLSGFWFGTGTPKFLVEILKDRELNIDYFKPIAITESELNSYDPLFISDIPLLFQSGYLTIKDKYFDGGNVVHYTLGVPNFEVELGFRDNLKDLYLKKVESKSKIFKDDI